MHHPEIVTAHSKELLEQEIKPAIETFLKKRGLELSQEKTRVTHIKEGFDFLGQNVRKYPNHGKLKLLIKPSKKSIHSFLEGITNVFRKARNITQAPLIQILNLKIRGWANYHRSVVSKDIFTQIDNIIWHLTLGWARRGHPHKNHAWILQKYYKGTKGSSHRFGGTEIQEDGTAREFILIYMAYTPIRRHLKIQGVAHPFDVKYDEYFEKRTSDKWRNNSKRLNIENQMTMCQEDKCPCCKERITIKHHWYISLKRKASKGGEYKFGNIDIIHSGCYEKWQQESSALQRTVKPVTDRKGDLLRARAG
jgi:RNA-directed DNA polymerase